MKTETFDLAMILPPKATPTQKAELERQAGEKLLADVRALGYDPIGEVRFLWRSFLYGTASVRAVEALVARRTA